MFQACFFWYIGSMELSRFWDRVPRGWRHFTGEMSEEKKAWIVERVDRCLLSKINADEVNEVLDWGCGGGLFDPILAKMGRVSVVDISRESLAEARRYAPEIAYAQPLTEEPGQFQYGGKTPDLLFSNEVIQHFPSFAYFQEVVALWCDQIQPRMIAIQVKLNPVSLSAEQYESGFLNGLLLNEADVVAEFSSRGYEVISRAYEYARSKGRQQLGYFVFQKST